MNAAAASWDLRVAYGKSQAGTWVRYRQTALLQERRGPAVASAVGPALHDVVVTPGGESPSTFLVTADDLSLMSETLSVASGSTTLLQRAYWRDLELSVAVDGGAPEELGRLSSSASASVPRAETEYLVNVAGRDVRLSGEFGAGETKRTVADIRHLVVVYSANLVADVYEVLGITAGRADAPPDILKGEVED